jgi:hypothetical protein
MITQDQTLIYKVTLTDLIWKECTKIIVPLSLNIFLSIPSCALQMLITESYMDVTDLEVKYCICIKNTSFPSRNLLPSANVQYHQRITTEK